MSKRITDAEYQAALTEAHGVLAWAARRLGCSRTAVYAAVARNPELKQTLDDSRAEVLDLAESKLIQAVHAGHMPAVFFVLRTLGRDRGYVFRQDRSAGDFDAEAVKNMSDDELAAARRALRLN